jgi:hypothetical protein
MRSVLMSCRGTESVVLYAIVVILGWCGDSSLQQDRADHSAAVAIGRCRLDREGRLVSVALPGSDPRRAGAPRPLFDTGLEASAGFDQFAVGPKGRFLFRLPFGSDPGVPVHVILDWHRPHLAGQD